MSDMIKKTRSLYRNMFSLEQRSENWDSCRVWCRDESAQRTGGAPGCAEERGAGAHQKSGDGEKA